MSQLVQLEPLPKANTIGNRIEEFISVELARYTVREKSAVRRSLIEFTNYVSRMGEITPSVVASYPETVFERGLSARSVQYRVLFIRRFFKWCVLMGYSTTRWGDYFPRIRSAPVPEPVIIRQEEYLNIRKHCTDRDREWIVVLSFNTGMRMGDCCKLRWSHVDTKKQTIKKIVSKTALTTGKSVFIPYNSGSDLHFFLMDMFNTKDDLILEDDNYVCPVMYLSYANNSKSVVESFRKIFNKAGLPNNSFKHLRNTFESRLANSGMNMALAASITGRSDPKALMRYIKPDMEAAREGITKALEIHHHLKGFA